ncbi:long-chain fatty acid--CoA ligase [Roseateles sp. DAIF2]|uniref:long-chain fatty acid--CoA ligase n=1 Tax=Roseateles sp. DAIF2 TaxID=2714952 RepID=UPI0018A2E901|nr:long-chain fatty acid--CoA ligase [Roseateles sp. DAIF2]QPF75163.1 long-chain fatty acid--CoA ligase [Roseateles sp. DAIF2]
MSDAAHFKHWPPGLPRHLSLPRVHLFHNIEVSAARYPDKACTLFYGRALSYAEFRREAEALAGWLQRSRGLQRGERVLLFMQNSPQWLLAYYAILRADAVVVPVNAMNRGAELRHYVEDSGARLAIVAQDLLPELAPLLGQGALEHLLVACYRDHLGEPPPDLSVPDFVAAPRLPALPPHCSAWDQALAAGQAPGPMQAGPEDLAVMPYTSGTTGRPKGCMHTHASVMSTLVGGICWFGRTQDAVYLAALPFFHVTGMSGSMNGPLYIGATIVILPRWDRELAARLIARHRVTVWQSISTMMIDFLANPRLAAHDLSSLAIVRGGGAAMPAAVCARLKALTGLDYVEGYGMSEAMAATHINPVHRPKAQCLGMPVFDVEARIVDPATLAELPPGEAGEILVHGPQLMQGYWRAPEATAEAFVELDGKRFLRTGDMARVDEDGYFFMTDRLKRMINASGYKVWPAEVEALMYHHPAVLEACVIGVPDARRGETVKALVVLKPGAAPLDEAALIAWCHAHMAAYKSPRQIEFVAGLPKSGSGKVMWRELQDAARDNSHPGDKP